MLHHILVLPLLVLLSLANVTVSVDYTVTNNARTTTGGARFEREIGAKTAKKTLESATSFIWRVLDQTDQHKDRKNVKRVALFIDNMDGVAHMTSDQIHLSASYVANYNSGSLKGEVSGVLFHEMTHVWQWSGNGNAPGGLIEGIADYVRLKAGYVPGHWVRPGGGDKWDQGYDVTARFLDYCDGLRSGFVAELNKKMRSSYDNEYFVELLGKSVDMLWNDYKQKYN